MQFVDSAGKKSSSQRMLLYQAAAFGSIIILIWRNELLDLPALLLGAPETPVNWRESLFESSLVALVWAAISRKTKTLFLRMKYLEGLASCLRRLQADPLPRRRLAADRDIHRGPVRRRVHARHLPGLRRAALS